MIIYHVLEQLFYLTCDILAFSALGLKPVKQKEVSPGLQNPGTLDLLGRLAHKLLAKVLLQLAENDEGSRELILPSRGKERVRETSRKYTCSSKQKKKRNGYPL